MTNKQRRTKLKAGLIIALAAVFLITLFAISISLSPNREAMADTITTFGERDSYVSVTGSISANVLESHKPGSDGLITKAEQLYYIFFSEKATGNYTLGANFRIEYINWAISGPTLRGNLNGAGYEIWNVAVPGKGESVPDNSFDYVGGLAGKVESGKTIENLYYYFSGSIYAKKVATDAYLAVGGMVGLNYGTIKNCYVDIAGSIETEGNAEGVTSVVGGMVGSLAASNSVKGQIINCPAIISTGDISAYNDKESNSSSKHSIVYAGGVIGKVDGGILRNNSIKSSATVISADNTEQWEEESIVGTILDIFGAITGYDIEMKTAYNDKEHIHPAGVVIGGVDSAGQVLYNQVESTGSAISYGTAGSSNGGSIAGGFIGVISETGTSNLTIQSNSVSLQCNLNAFMVATFSLANEVIEAASSAFGLSERDKRIYLGAAVGKCLTSASIKFINNYFAIESDDGIIESGADYESDDYNCETGLLCGNADLANKVGANNWISRKLSESDTGRIAGNETQSDNASCKLNHLVIFGDGEVSIQGGKITQQEEFTITSKPICSPFYGYTSDISQDNPSFTTTKTKTLSKSSKSVMFAVFIDTEIETAGELTQLARDINQIKLKVYANLGTSGVKDSDGGPLMYFAGKQVPTLKWLNVTLTKNILVRNGTPVIEDFYGTFNGGGNTISFAAGSKIQHDFEKDADNKDKDKDDDNDIIEHDEYATGLFGIIKSGAAVYDLNIIFGGAIDESGGTEYRELKDSGDKIKAKKMHKTDEETYKVAAAEGGDANSIYNNTFSMASFVLPTYTTYDEVYFYALSGDGYSASRDYNPGFIQVVPYKVDVIVGNAYMGILAGKNYGAITNVNVEATKSAFVTCSGNDTYFGTLCGLNAGEINNAAVTMNGKAVIRGRTSATFGGMIGINTAPANSAFRGLNAFVGGEVKLEGIYNYHLVRFEKYTNAKYKDGTNSPDDGYEVAAFDTTSGSDKWSNALDDALGIFEVKDMMSVSTYRVYGNDVTISESIGTLIGVYQASAATFTDMAAVSGSKGTFNTKIYQNDSANAKVGAAIGRLASGAPTFVNGWAVMAYDEFKDGGRQPIGTVTQSTGINLVYVQKTIAIAEVDINSALPVSFTLSSQEGMVFSGWYNYTSGERVVVTTGLEGNVFTPQNQEESNRIYVAELLNLQLFTAEEFNVLSASTNEGRGYEGVEFTMGTGVVLSSFTPIGTLEKPFLGTFSGNGLTVTLASAATGDYVGLFGCVGSTATIKNVTVRVTGKIGSQNVLYGGAVAAVNYGTIGQDTSTGKVIAEIEGWITARCAGGIVGANHRIVKNAEVYFLYSSEISYGKVIADSSASDRVYAGGAIGYNEYKNEATIAKNLIVYYADTLENAPITSTKPNYAIGGVIGENANGAAAYSLVSVFNYADIFGEDFPGSNGKQSQYRGLIIGYNASKDNVDSLWALCLSKSKTSDNEYDPELGEPLAVYRGEDKNVTTGEAVLLSGENCQAGNILIKYGWGDVSVAISGAETVKGGQISFLSSKLSRPDGSGNETVPDEKRVTFYDYIADFVNGNKVPVSEGNIGYTFSPTVGSTASAGLTGKVYYAGFCNTTIASQEDYKAVAANVANNYRLYVKYNIANNFTLDETASIAIGSAEKPFVGSINGNAYTVTMHSSSSLHAFVGVLGGEQDTLHTSEIRNLFFEVRSGNYSLTNTENAARGFLTDVNYGTIANVSLSIHGYLKNMKGSAGVVAGINYGKIESASIRIEYAKAFGKNGFGAIFGRDVGGVVGENYGEIGNSMPNSIDVTISREGSYNGILYATGAVGAIAGINREDGVIRSAIVTVSGTVVGGYASALVGENEGHIENALVTIAQGATYAGTDAFGAIAGRNSGLIGYENISAANYVKVVKSYIYEAPRYGDPIDVMLGEETVYSIPATRTAVIGGIVGINAESGNVNALIVEAHAKLIASGAAGGIAGQNLGSITSATLTTSVGSDIVAGIAGGVVGVNSGVVDRVVATFRGTIGSTSAGENGIVATSFAGGFFGKNQRTSETITNSAVAIYTDVYGETVGLAAGECTASSANNAWVQICNSSLSPVVGGSDPALTGFNVIRVLNDTLLGVELAEKTGRFSFVSQISTTVKKWYTDISNWTDSSGYLTKMTGKVRYDSDLTESNVTYYVCYDELLILNYTDFNGLATKINSHSYYYNVLFRLGGDIMVDSGKVLRPIGTAEYPFNGIFDGAYYSVTMQKDSAISGQEYTGLFGYTAQGSVIKNLAFSVQEKAAIGSVNSYWIGSLVGYNRSAISNVYVNLSVSLTYNSKRLYAGELIGYQEAMTPSAENVWISVLNGKNPVVGNMTESTQYGVNHLGVLGNGLTEVRFYPSEGTLSEARKNYLSGAEVTISGKYTAVRGFSDFGGWYDDIRNENSKIKPENTYTGLGQFFVNPDEEDVWMITDADAANKRVTLSFIKLAIESEEDFVKFADNIKKYGDQGAVFKLEADIVVDYTNCVSVGTPDRPFTGTFDGQGHVITVTGNVIKREYAGVFGYVGTNGMIKNLLIDVGENVKFGDNDALYSGVAVALLYGSIKNVVVRVHADTVVYTTQGSPSSGGIVGRAGKLNEDASIAYFYTIDNCWLIVEENATVTEPMGRQVGDNYDTFYANHGVGRKMQMVGSVDLEDDPFETNPFKKGALTITISAQTGDILFDATNGGSVFYGFINNATSDESQMTPISDIGTNIKRWTVREGSVYGDVNDPKPASADMLCIFINKYITTVEEFLMISENVSKGRNYRGIIYELGADLEITADVLPNGVYTPIGGEVKVESGAGFESFIERDFVGGFYGNGHTIAFASDVVIDARYAGLFGRVGADARIRDLILTANCTIGKDNAENTVRTIYAGVLAAYALGGKYDNIVVVLEKNATLFGSVGTGRAFGYLPTTLTSDVATNSWVISYNSKANYEENESELSYNKGGEGNNQGGFNSMMVIAAGLVDVNRNGNKYFFTYTDPNAEANANASVNPYWTDRYVDEAAGEYWHTESDYVGSNWPTTFKNNGFYPDGSEKRRIYNVSFLKSEISSYADLQKYATNVNEGYNFYKLTFTLTEDITIESGFVGIGTVTSGMNGTFNGNKHTITLPSESVIEGEYAGIFGYVSEDGEITNLRIVLAGTVGRNSYTKEDIDNYHVANTRYAGAVAYNNGVLRNVIVISQGVRIKTLEGKGGLVIGYDATNLLDNVWALVDASSYVDSIGVCAVGDTLINTMIVIGIGEIDADFDTSSYQVKFTSDGVIPVMGWYKSFEKNQQISKAMLSNGDLANGIDGYLLAPNDYSGVRYEVAVIKTTLTEVRDLVAIAEDVNVGGYSFENITFNLGANIVIDAQDVLGGLMPIGSSENRFKGTFSGRDADHFYTIYYSSGCTGYGLFGFNAGTITDLTVVVNGTIGTLSASSDNVYGAIACTNLGTIRRSYVRIGENGKVVGYSVGGIVGANYGTVSDSVIVVMEGGRIVAETSRKNVVNAGAVAGVNYGTIEGASDFTYWNSRALLPTDDARIAKNGKGAEANVFIYGTVAALSHATDGSAATNAGGAVGNQYDGYLNYMIVYLTDGGKILSDSPNAGMSRAGGFVGYARAAMSHSVVFLYGTIESKDYLGGTAGYLDGVIALNVWQVTLNRIVDAAGEGARTVNSLNIKGNGKVKAAIDLFTKRVIFTNVTDNVGTDLDGWYTAVAVNVDEKTGNIGENGNTFLPLNTIQNKYVMVIFVNTEIYSVADFNEMASSVSGGLSGSAIVFTLKNDIEIEEGELTSLIGTVEYPFNNVFDGNGKKIILKSGALAGDTYVALFGYTGATAVIRDLTVEVQAGVYGSREAEHGSILVAYNEGTIKDVVITLEKDAVLIGQTTGVVAATSFGTIENVELTISGSLSTLAYSGNEASEAVAEDTISTAIAGGLVGANDGTITHVKVTLTEDGSITAAGASTSYAGILVGENYKTISVVEIYDAGALTAEGTMVAYSGGAAGVNLGNLYNVYVEIDGGTFEGNSLTRSAGFVGNNVNALSSSLVKIVGETFHGTDSVVAYSKAKDVTKVKNVWVYSDVVENASSTDCINSMICDAMNPITVSCPTAAEVTEGKIAFTGDVADMRAAIALFALITPNGTYEVGSGAAMDNVVYSTDGDHKYITYLTYDDVIAGDVVSRPIADVRVRFVTRTNIGSGTELYAFALALNSGVYQFYDARFKFTSDFTLPERAFPSIHLPATASLSGEHHVVTVGNAVLTNGLFERNEGTIERIGIRLTKAETGAYLVKENVGTLKNAVVYLENGASMTGGYFAETNSGTYQNLWVVTREDIALGQGILPYTVIKINGVGTLRQSGGNGLTFTANSDDEILFIGYTAEVESVRSFFSYDALYDTAEKMQGIYTAEFISKTLDTDYKLRVLSDVSALGYNGEGMTFSVGADLTAEQSLFTETAFLGVIEGNGHAIKAHGITGALFGKYNGEIRDLVIDLTEGGTLTLFDESATASLYDVVILEERDTFVVGDGVQPNGVWVVTENATLYGAFENTYAGYSVLYKNGSVKYIFNEGISATAADDEDRVFAGWYADMGASIGVAARKGLTLTLPRTAGNRYLLNYINRTFTCTDDLVRLGKAVGNGFDFEGVTFRVADGGFTVEERIATIGDAENEFKGNIYGGSKSAIVYVNYGDDTFEVEPFLYRVNGEIKELIFEYKEGATFAAGARKTVIVENAGTMQGIVVISKNAALFEGGAGLTLKNGGDIKNCWLVTRGTDRAVTEGSLVGVNEMRVDDTIVEVSFSESVGTLGTRVFFRLSAGTGKFLALYDFDGAVVFPGNYSSGAYTAPATASGVKIVAKSINEIVDQDELVYLGYATASGNLAEGKTIKVGADIEIKRNLKALQFKGLTLDLCGHYLDLTASSATAEMVFGADKNAVESTGTVKNGAIYLHKGCYGIGVTGLSLTNVVLFLCDNGMDLPDYRISDEVKIVTEDRTRKSEITTFSGTYNYLYAPKAAYAFDETPSADAAFRATFDAENDYKIGFVGQESALYYYGGTDEIGTIESIAYFAAKQIDSADKFVDFVHAAYLSQGSAGNDYLKGATVTIVADVTVDGALLKSITLSFAGTLLGGNKTVTIEGGVFSSDWLIVKEGGKVSNLAIAFKGSTIGAEHLVNVEEDGSTERLVLVVYQTGSGEQSETAATVVNVYGEGDIEVTFGTNTITYTAKEHGNYALREWRSVGGESLGSNKSIDTDEAISARFELRYYVSVSYVGISEDILKKNERDLPTFSGVGVIFAEDVSDNKTVVNVQDIGKNFLLTGVTATGAEAAVGSNAWTYTLTLTPGTYNVTLNVDLEYIEMIWESVKYRADETTFTAYDTLKSDLLSRGYSVEYKYKALGDTPGLVNGKPYHAGTYLVTLDVSKGSGDDQRFVCRASCGLIIEKAILIFKSVAIEDKDYDGTTNATKAGEVILEGFLGSDGNYITYDGLTFHFADKNAGQGKPVYVTGEGSLGYKVANELTESEKKIYPYVYLNYDFDEGSITSDGVLIRANIRLKTLILKVDSVTVEYLDQFGDSAPALIPTVVSGLIEEDRAAFEERASGLITRERADTYDVGYYRIVVGNSFAFPNYEVRLQAGSEAYYIVTPSEICIEFDDDDVMYYGDKTHSPKYHLFVGKKDAKTYKALHEGDTLYFSEVVYNDGATMLPGETKYSFVCVFSAENKNYTVDPGTNGYRIVNGKALPVLVGDQTLTVSPKKVTVTARSDDNTKRFGKRTESVTAELAAGNSFVEKDAKFVVSRAAGEKVGTYKLSYSVVGENGADYTSRYTFLTQSGADYYFTITPVAIRIKPIKTQIIYGDSVSMIKYGIAVEGGGITIADLYYATKGTEKADATLEDIGIGISLSEDLKGTLSVGEYDAVFDIVKTNENISEVRTDGAQKMIVVQKRYLNLIIKDIKRNYNGTSEVNQSLFGYSIDPTQGFIGNDRSSVKIKVNGYKIAGQSASVGVYKIDGDFELESTSGNVADNYYLTYTQGTFTIQAIDVKVTAEIGYFDEEGTFIPAVINRSGAEYEGKIYYGDSKATFNYSLDKEVPFLELPDGTDKEISDYIADTLKISHYRLNGLVPEYYDALDVGMISANNNYKVTFTAGFDIEPVYLTVKLISSVKTIGQPDPGIEYEIIATDPNNDNEVIEGYDKIAEGTFKVVISAERSEGETLGSYTYDNITVEILNLAVGESLTDETSTSGQELGGSVEFRTEGLTLSIKQKSFLKTTLGKVVLYGVPLLVLVAVVVLLIIFIPRIRKKRREEDEFDPHNPDGTNGTTPTGGDATGGDDAVAQDATTQDTAVQDSAAQDAAQPTAPVTDPAAVSDSPITTDPVTDPAADLSDSPITTDPVVEPVTSDTPVSTDVGVDPSAQSDLLSTEPIAQDLLTTEPPTETPTVTTEQPDASDDFDPADFDIGPNGQ